jgi:peptide/nickel transport system permease protein
MDKPVTSRLPRFASQIGSIIGLILVILYFIVALAAPWLAPTRPGLNPADPLVVGRFNDFVARPPGPDAPLGTLPGQIDVYHSLVWGTRTALLFGLTVAACAAAFGLLLGAAGAYWGGWANRLVLRITDAFLSVPVVAGAYFCKQLLVLIMTGAGIEIYINGSLDVTGVSPQMVSFLLWINPILIGFILFSWMPYARLTNTLVLRMRQADFILAARAMGASPLYIVIRHLIPNVISPSITLAARDISMVVMLQATFQFIGLDSGFGWGKILQLGRSYLIAPGGNLLRYWWMFVPVTLAIVLFSVGWNLLGDGLNDRLNPHRNRLSF